mgnify:CR=1 FL=1
MLLSPRSGDEPQRRASSTGSPEGSLGGTTPPMVFPKRPRYRITTIHPAILLICFLLGPEPTEVADRQCKGKVERLDGLKATRGSAETAESVQAMIT